MLKILKKSLFIVPPTIYLFGCLQRNEFFSEYSTRFSHLLLNPEQCNKLAIIFLKNLKYFIFLKNKDDYIKLATNVWGKNFSNPIGMSAGFDKNGECIDGGFDIGFGFVELGTTIPQPQPGNNKPRLFRLTNDHALINRMGCNSEGFSALLNRIKKYRKKGGKNIVGVNIGINRDSSNPIGDYVQGIKTFSSYADYIAINISSPNTPGLRSFQEKDKLTKLLTKIKETTEELKYPKPLVFLKLSPDLSEAECLDIAKIVKDPKTSVDGLILTNTTIERPGSLTSSLRFELGGLSGRPLKDKSTKMIKLFYELTGGTIPIIGVGGIENGQDAFDKIASGASLVQLYTSFTYGGFGTINKIQRELHNILGDKGYKSVAEAVGSSCNNFVTPQ